MLNIYFKDECNYDKNNTVTNVEQLFEHLKVKGTDIDKKLINLIEKGKYLNEYSFIDRFGYKLHYEDMSTGCKAALCVANYPNKIIDLLECGCNARDIIISICKNGNIIIRDNSIAIKDYSNSIDVKVDNYKIKSVKRLNKYINSERPFEPDISMEEISYVSNQ